MRNVEGKGAGARQRAWSGALAIALAGFLALSGAEASAAEWLQPAAGAKAGGEGLPVQVDRQAARAAIDGDVLPVQLPEAPPFEIRAVRVLEDLPGRYTLAGQVETSVGRRTAVLTFAEQATFAVLPMPDGRLMQLTTRNGQTLLRESGGMVPKTTPGSAPALPDFLVPGTEPGAAAKAAPQQGGTQLQRASETPGGIEIDVLGVYTTDLRAMRGGVAAVEAEFSYQIAGANLVYADSGLAVRFRLVGLREVPFAEDMTNNDVLYAVTDNNLPDGFDLHALRDQLAADLVAVLRPYRDGHGSCGVAWLNGGGLSALYASEAYGFSVNNVEPCGSYVLAHELGHNVGSHHDAETAGDSYGAYPYSYGYRQDGPPAFATVMAYEEYGQVWLGEFSRPGGTSCRGVACGVADEADNVRSLDQMAPRIARFRDPPGTISVLDASMREGSPGALTFTVRLSEPAPAGGVSFTMATANGSATDGADYNGIAPFTYTIPATSREARIGINVYDDTAREGDETFYLRISNVNGASLFDGEGIGLIRDDDPRAMVSGRVVVAEGSPEPTSPLTVLVDMFDGQSRSQSTLVVNPPQFAYSTQVPFGADVTLSVQSPPAPLAPASVKLRKVESDQVADITLRRRPIIRGRIVFPEGVAPPDKGIPVGAFGLDDSGWGRIVPAFPPDFRFEFEAMPGSDVSLDATGIPPPFLSRIDLQLDDVYEDVAVEMVAVKGLTVRGQVRFAPGVEPPGNEVQVGLSREGYDVADRVYAHPPEFRYEFALAGPTTALSLTAYGIPPLEFLRSKVIGDVAADAVHDVEIGSAPELRMESVRVPEGNVGVTQAEVRLVLSSPSSGNVVAQLRTRDGSAQAGRDYSPIDTDVLFQAGQQARSVFIPIPANTQADGDRIFSVDLVGGFGFVPVATQALVAIQDDDGGLPAPALAIGDVQVLEGDAGETLARFPLYLSRPAPAGGVRFDLATADGTALAGSDYVAFPAPGWEIPAGSLVGEFAVRVLGDTSYEPEESFFARISNVGGATLARAEGTATIHYDDTPLPPTPVRDHYVVRAGQPLQVQASRGVLANDIHPRRNEIRVGQNVNVVPRGGQVSLATDGGFGYQPKAGYEGEDRFVYSACHFYHCRYGEVLLSVATELSTGDRYLWMFPPAANQAQQGFVRLVNREARSGEVQVWGIDATGRRSAGTITLTLAPHESRQFNSQDAEWGNPDKGLTGALGSGTGNWTLVVRSELDLEPLAYIRTPDGFLTSMHDRVDGDGVDWVVPVFNPAENVDQVSWLRLVNTTLDDVQVEITGTDDAGRPGEGSVVATVPARGAREFSAVDLESGDASKGLAGRLGNGEGKWRLQVGATGRITVQSLLADPRGYLTNLSSLAPSAAPRMLWRVTPAANAQQQGFIRITNLESRSGTVTLTGVDDAGRASPGTVSFTLAPFASQQLNSQDLEAGNPAKGATGALGAGQGQWRLQVDSMLSLEMMGLVRTPDGFLTTLHEVVPGPSLHWRVPMFNPGANTNQVSVLRVVNPNAQAAVVAIQAVDDAGRPAPGGALSLTVPANGAVELDARELETGAAGKGLSGALGAGSGKWRLELDAALPLTVMSLLRDPGGYLTNLSSGTEAETTRLDP